jgi:hypothetical protein
MIVLRNPTCFLMMVMYVWKEREEKSKKNEEKHSKNLYYHLDSTVNLTFFLKCWSRFRKEFIAFLKSVLSKKGNLFAYLFENKLVISLKHFWKNFLGYSISLSLRFFHKDVRGRIFDEQRKEAITFIGEKSL